MNKITFRITALLFMCLHFPIISHATEENLLDQAITGEHRDPKNISRDKYRHPKETLLFFGIKPDMHVVEVLSGRGWYTEILAPYLRENGLLTITSFGENSGNEYLTKIHNGLMSRFDAAPYIYDKVRTTVMESDGYLGEIKDSSQDMVLTFRNTHNWIRFGGIEEAYAAIYRVLKPGGTLGVVQHRANTGSDPKATAQTGYVPEETIIKLCEKIGFKLLAKSEVNANPKDSKDYPKGVWTLPPSYRMGDVDKEKWTAIGESDRMTLKFTKQ